MRGQSVALVAIGCVVLGILGVGLLPISVPSGGNLVVPNGIHLRPVGLLAEGSTVIQQWVAEGTDLQSVGVLLATYRRVDHGTLQITVFMEANGRWEAVAATAVDETTLRDNAMYTLAIPASAHIARGTPLQIALQSDGEINEAVTWWENPDWERDGYALTYNGQTLDGTAIMQLSYRPETRTFYRQAGAIWRQSTHFATPFWQAILLSALVATLGGIVLLIRRPLGEE